MLLAQHGVPLNAHSLLIQELSMADKGLSSMKPGSPLGVRENAVDAAGTFIPHVAGVIPGEAEAAEAAETEAAKPKGKGKGKRKPK